MKKAVVILGVLALASAAWATQTDTVVPWSGSASAWSSGQHRADQPIYDVITGSTTWTTTGGLPRYQMADGFWALEPTPGYQWEIHQIDVILFVAAAVNYADVTATVNFWNTWDPNVASGPVFFDLANQTTYSLGPVSTTGAAAYLVSFDYTTAPFTIPDPNDLGVEILWLADGVATNNLATGLRDAVPSVGVGTNLFYRDANANGYMEPSDARVITGWTNTNVGLTIWADEVLIPEPTSLLLLGLAGLLIRRR